MARRFYQVPGLLLLKSEIMTKIWTEMKGEGGQVEVQVNIQDAPADFFGTSFHLNFGGATIVGWDYELGSLFGEEKPFVLVAEKDNALVTGLAFQRGNHAVLEDGNLITFYVQVEGGEEVTLSFDYPVMSRFENGRKDVENVEWIGSQLGFEPEAVQEEPDFVEEPEERTEDFQTSTLTYPPDGFEADSVTDVYLFMFGFGSFICAIAGLVYLYYRYRKTML